MFNKSFISIYFLPDKLLIFELAGGKKVKKYATVDLPKEAMKGYVVSDKAALSETLKVIWSKLKLKEKAVGLILPEFSTFTKLLKLPKLDPTELGEAIAWQAQEYLPKQATDMIMDWKIVEKTPAGFEVLMVAIDKRVLTGYVEASEAAGLLPLVVETPSICLTRLTKDAEFASLTVYKSSGETILVVSEKKKIIGTSVLRDEKDDVIAKLAQKMVAHYKEVDVKNLFVGGGNLSDNLVEKLVSSLKIKPQKIETHIPDEKGIIQEYLIPLSLQLEEAAEPGDPTSLNLLPETLVAKYRRERLKLQVWGLTLTITLFVWISFFMTLGAYLLILQQINDLTAQAASAQKTLQIQDQVSYEINYINQVSEKILKIKGDFFLPQKVLNDISRVKPQGLSINEYDADLDTGNISVAGIAPDRVTLIDFKQKLEDNADFESVEIPISSFEKVVNIEFQIRFKYIPAVKTVPVKKPIQPT